MSFSQLYVDSLVPINYEFTLTDETDHYKLFMKDFVDVTGAKLDNPLTDMVPIDKTDSHVWDQDGEGNPGLRIDVVGNIPLVFDGDGTMDVAAKTVADIDLSTIDDNTIWGSFLWQGVQVIYQASNDALERDKTTVPDHDNSSIKFVRIDDTYDCAKVIAEKDTLFE
jgi:hypothetical protein